MENNDTSWFKSKANFPNGFGRFPYIILKVGYAIYMQIPIHFNVENEDSENFPGTHINDIDEYLLESYIKDKSSPLHQILIDHCRKIKHKLEKDKGQSVRLCLVEGENIAHYFEVDSDFPHTSIPKGGTLITQTHEVISIVSDHFIK